MKENMCLKYQYTVFGDFSDIMPEKSEVIIKLMKLYSKENFIPATFQELSMNKISPRMEYRIMLTNKDGISISIGNKRLDLTVDYNDEGAYKDMDIHVITEKAVELMILLIQEFKKTGNRIALNVTKLLNEEQSKIIVDRFKETKNILEYYDENVPFEWNERFVAKVQRSQYTRRNKRYN